MTLTPETETTQHLTFPSQIIPRFMSAETPHPGDLFPGYGFEHYDKDRPTFADQIKLGSTWPTSALDDAFKKLWKSTLNSEMPPYALAMEAEKLMKHPYFLDLTDEDVRHEEAASTILESYLSVYIDIASSFFSQSLALHALGKVPGPNIRARERNILFNIRVLTVLTQDFRIRYGISRHLGTLARNIVPLLTSPGRFSDREIFVAIEIFGPSYGTEYLIPEVVSHDSFPRVLDPRNLRPQDAGNHPTVFGSCIEWLIEKVTCLLDTVSCCGPEQHFHMDRVFHVLGVHLHFQMQLKPAELSALHTLVHAFLSFMSSEAYFRKPLAACMCVDLDIVNPPNVQVESWLLWILSQAVPYNPEAWTCFYGAVAHIMLQFQEFKHSEAFKFIETGSDSFVRKGHFSGVNLQYTPDKFREELGSLVMGCWLDKKDQCYPILSMSFHWFDELWGGDSHPADKFVVFREVLVDVLARVSCDMDRKLFLEIKLVLLFLKKLQYLGYEPEEDMCVEISQMVDSFFVAWYLEIFECYKTPETRVRSEMAMTIVLNMYKVPHKLNKRYRNSIHRSKEEARFYSWFRPKKALKILGCIREAAHRHNTDTDVQSMAWNCYAMIYVLIAFGAPASMCKDFHFRDQVCLISKNESEILDDCQISVMVLDVREEIRWNPIRIAWVVGVVRAGFTRKC